MKKLLMVLAVAFGFAAVANATDYSKTSFEQYLDGGVSSKVLNTAEDDLGGDGAAYWRDSGLTDSFVTNDTAFATEYTGDRPTQFATGGESTQNNYLVVDATEPLERYVLERRGSDPATVDIGDGLYFDSLVKFTAADQPSLEPTTGDKLVVWMQSIDADDGQGIAGQTNLVVTAGFITGDDTPAAAYTNYVLDITVEPNTWHRLTIKAISDITSINKGVPGFVVFIDGVAAESTAAKGTGTIIGSLSAVAQNWGDALFPSLIVTGPSKQKITSVSFKGSGAVDDLVFTTTAPDFAADGTYFTLNWDPAAYTALSVNNEAVAINAGKQIFPVLNAGATFEISYTLVSGYNMSDPTTNGCSFANNTFTANGTSVATLNTAQALYQVGVKTFGTFADALAEALKDGAAGTIKLLADAEIEYDGESSAPGCAYINEDEEVTIDLNGKKIKGTATIDDPAQATIYVGGGSVTIIDTFGGGIVEGPSLQDGAEEFLGAPVCVAAGSAQLTAGQYDGNVDPGDGTLTITGGSYQSENDSEFYLDDCYDHDNYSATYANGYWTVTSGEPPTPVEDDCLITFDGTFANFTYEAYTNDTVKLTKTDNTVTVKQGATVKVVQKPNVGYEYVLDPGVVTENYFVDGYGNLVMIDQIGDEETLDWTLTEPTAIPPEPTTYAVSFYTNSVDAANLVAVTNIAKDAELTAAEIPAIFAKLEGTWDSNPVGAVITEATNFVFTISTGKTYPIYIPDVAEIKEKFDIWADDKNGGDRDVSGEDLDAFLLNCKPDEVEEAKKAFKITSIEKVGGEWVVKACDKVDGEEYLNGYVNIVPYDINGEAADPENAEFFQATLTIQPVN